MQQGRKVDVIGIQMDLGASRRGVNMGPSAIRYSGLLGKNEGPGAFAPRLRGHHPAHSAGRRGLQPCAMRVRLTRPMNGCTAQSERACAPARLPVVLGGDRCVAAGSIPAVAEELGEIGVIWIDAHGDFNSDKSTPSGNMHGMPLSAVCGCRTRGDGLLFKSTRQPPACGAGRRTRPGRR